MERELVEYLQAMEERMTVNLATVVRDEVTSAVSQQTQKLSENLRSEMTEAMAEQTETLGQSLRAEMAEEMQKLGGNLRSEMAEEMQKLGGNLRSEMTEEMQKLGGNLRSEMTEEMQKLGQGVRSEVAEEIDGRFKLILETIHQERQELAAEMRVETHSMLTEFSRTIIEQIQDLRRDISGVHEDHRLLAEMWGVHELEIRVLKAERGHQ